MFIWIQKALFKNGKYLFGALLAVVIVAFVFTFTPAGGGAIGPSRTVTNEFMGYNLHSRRDLQPVLASVIADSYFNNYHAQLRMNDESTSALLRLHIAKIAEADRLGIPAPTEAEVRRFIQSQDLLRGEDGEFDPEIWGMLTEQVRSQVPRGASDAEILRALENLIRIQKVDRLLGGSGYNAASLAEKFSLVNAIKRDAQVVTVSYSDFRPEIEPTEAELKEYYEANQFNYETGEKLDLTAVVFPSSAYQDQIAEPTEADARDYYEQNQFRYVRQPAEGEDASGDLLYRPFDEVQESIMTTLRNNRGAEIAASQAADFSMGVYREAATPGSDAFNELASTFGGDVRDLEAFSVLSPVETRGIPSTVLRRVASRLNADNPISDIQNIPEGRVVFIFQNREPSVVRPYDEVADTVRSDFISAKRRELFMAKGNEIKAEIERKVAEGKSFEEAAADLELSLRSYEGVSASNLPEGFPRTILAQLGSGDSQTVSPFISSANDGYVYYVTAVEVPEVDRESAEYQMLAEGLKNQLGGISSSSFFSEVVAREKLP